MGWFGGGAENEIDNILLSPFGIENVSSVYTGQPFLIASCAVASLSPRIHIPNISTATFDFIENDSYFSSILLLENWKAYLPLKIEKRKQIFPLVIDCSWIYS